jgi:hypothetical protein
VYRKLLPRPVMALSRGIYAAQETLERGVAALAHRAVEVMRDPLRFGEPYLGRGLFQRGPHGGGTSGERQAEYSEHRYRPPVGVTMVAVLLVFGGLALWHLLRLARGA